MSVHLEWVGHACFRLWEDGGPVIAMDPYTPSVVAAAVGLADPTELDIRLQADTVIVSSLTDAAHSYFRLVEGEPRVINALDVAQGRCEAKIDGEPLIAAPAAEAPEHPEGPKRNAVYAVKFSDVWVMHLGDLGYGFDADQLAPFAGRCDVLLAIVGEKLTLKLDELDPMINILKPTWIVPMQLQFAADHGGVDQGGRVSQTPLPRPRHLCPSPHGDLSTPSGTTGSTDHRCARAFRLSPN